MPYACVCFERPIFFYFLPIRDIWRTIPYAPTWEALDGGIDNTTSAFIISLKAWLSPTPDSLVQKPLISSFIARVVCFGSLLGRPNVIPRSKANRNYIIFLLCLSLPKFNELSDIAIRIISNRKFPKVLHWSSWSQARFSMVKQQLNGGMIDEKCHLTTHSREH